MKVLYAYMCVISLALVPCSVFLFVLFEKTVKDKKWLIFLLLFFQLLQIFESSGHGFIVSVVYK